EIVLTPNHEETRLSFLHPCLPFRVSVHVGSVVVEQIALNLRLSRLIHEVKLFSAQITIIAIDVWIVSDMARPRRLQRQKICAKLAFVRRAIFPELAAGLPIPAPTFVWGGRTE